MQLPYDLNTDIAYLRTYQWSIELVPVKDEKGNFTNGDSLTAYKDRLCITFMYPKNFGKLEVFSDGRSREVRYINNRAEMHEIIQNEAAIRAGEDK